MAKALWRRRHWVDLDERSRADAIVFAAFVEAFVDDVHITVVLGDPVSGQDGGVFVVIDDFGFVSIAVHPDADLAFGSEGAAAPAWYRRPKSGGVWRAATGPSIEQAPETGATALRGALGKMYRNYAKRLGSAAGLIAFPHCERTAPLERLWELPQTPDALVLTREHFEAPGALMPAWSAATQKLVAQAANQARDAVPGTAVAEAAKRHDFIGDATEMLIRLRAWRSEIATERQARETIVSGLIDETGARQAAEDLKAADQARAREDRAAKSAAAPPVDRPHPREISKRRLEAARRDAAVTKQTEIEKALAPYATCEPGVALRMPPLSLEGAQEIIDRHIAALARMPADDLAKIGEVTLAATKRASGAPRHSLEHRAIEDRDSILEGLNAIQTEVKRRRAAAKRADKQTIMKLRPGPAEDRRLNDRERLIGLCRDVFSDPRLAATKIIVHARRVGSVQRAIAAVRDKPLQFGRQLRAAKADADHYEKIRAALDEYLRRSGGNVT